MKQVVLPFFISFFISLSLYAQESDLVQSRIFEYDKQFYNLNYFGVRQFMRDRQIRDPEVYKELLPKFTEYRNKMNLGIGAFGAGSAISIIWGMAVISNYESDNYLRNYFLSFVPMMIGGGIYLAVYPRPGSLLNIISYHNTLPFEKKINLTLSLQGHSGIGPALVLNF